MSHAEHTDDVVAPTKLLYKPGAHEEHAATDANDE